MSAERLVISCLVGHSATMNHRAILLFGHADLDPASESLNHQLAESYVRGYQSSGSSIERINLAELTFDPILRAGFRVEQPLEPDLVRVKTAVEQADHLVWVFPTYWQSPPAVVRGLFDRLFLPGWAFKYEKGNPLPKGLLAGRSSRVLVTMDSPWFWYTLVNHRAVHRSFGGASLKFCGLSPVDFTTVYGVRELSKDARQKWCTRVEGIAQQDARRAVSKR